MNMRPFTGRCHTCGHDHDADVTTLRDVLDITDKARDAEIAALRAEIHLLRILEKSLPVCQKENDGLRAAATSLVEQNDSLRAEVERLRAENAELRQTLETDFGSHWEDVHDAVHRVEHKRHAEALAAERRKVEALETALRFYAQRKHFALSDADAWDTVSGEPQNYWCDDAGTATVEDGAIARAALAASQKGGE